MTTTKPQDKTTNLDAPRPPSRASSVFDNESHLTVLTPRAVAHVTAALQAIETLSGILFQRHEQAEFLDDAQPVDHLDTRGILNAIAICSTYTYDHILGGGLTSRYTLAIEKDEPGFGQIEQLTREARDLQKTARDKKRMAIVEGQPC